MRLRVFVPLFHFSGGVAIAHQQQIHFVARFAVLHDRPDLNIGWRRRAVDGRIRGIDDQRP